MFTRLTTYLIAIVFVFSLALIPEAAQASTDGVDSAEQYGVDKTKAKKSKKAKTAKKSKKSKKAKTAKKSKKAKKKAKPAPAEDLDDAELETDE